MRSLRQADYGDGDKEDQEEEEYDAVNGDDGDKVKTEQEDDREQEGNAEQEGGGRGAQPPSAPIMPIDVSFEPLCSDELSIWSPNTHAASTALFAILFSCVRSTCANTVDPKSGADSKSLASCGSPA